MKAYRREMVVSLHGRCDGPDPEDARRDRAIWREAARIRWLIISRLRRIGITGVVRLGAS